MDDIAQRAKTFVVIPAYNEDRVIVEVVEGLRRHFQNIVVVDDGSSDGTGEILKTVDAMLLTHAVNLGQGAALQTGIDYALLKGADWIVTFDADGQHRAADALEMVGRLWLGECDVVLGSRFLDEGRTTSIPPLRAMVLKMAAWAGSLFSGQRLTDAHNGLRAFNRKAAQTLDITQNGMAHASEILDQFIRAGMTIREHAVTIDYTDYSLRKGQSLFNALNILIDLQIGRFWK
jgi:polyprenyl-phospho-N-acetylgalactosaminyl synthase